MEGGNLELGPSTSGRGAGWEPPVRARCKCGSMSYSQEYMEAFGVALCSACKRDDKLITKTVAKDKYLLTEGDLKKLGSISKENPRHREWQPMRLYLQSQVERISRDKHGDEESLERTRDERVKKRILRKQERTVQNKAKDERKAKRLKITKERIEREYGDAARVHTCEVQVEEI